MRTSNDRPTVDIALSVFNGGSFVREQIESIQGQTYQEWRLWIRDDGSTDGTFELLEELAGEDSRIRAPLRDGRQLGAPQGFGWVLEQLPEDARFIFCSDADDVWLPQKVELSLGAYRASGGEASTPVLLHTDLSITDSKLRVLDPSLWHHLNIRPEPPSLRRLVAKNVVTGPTMLMNRALLQMCLPIPPETPHHDWWIALVAAAFGKIVSLPQATVLYRRHADNHTGEYHIGGANMGRLANEVLGAWERTPTLRQGLAVTAKQAEVLLKRYGDKLGAGEARLLREYAEIPRCSFLRRELRVLRLRALPEQGLARNLALLLRA